MDDHPTHGNAGSQAEIRFTADELAMIAQGETSLARGDYVAWEEIRTWMASLGTEGELPEPPQRKR